MSAIADSLLKTMEENAEDIKQEWRNDALAEDDEAFSQEIETNITEDSPKMVCGEYRASGQAMWVHEYGKGSEMDPENPYLDDYKSSKYWNENRGPDGEIRTRTGPYKDLDGNVHEGSGIGGPKGLNIEWFEEKEPVTHRPQHTIERIAAGNTARNALFVDSITAIMGAKAHAALEGKVEKP